MVSEDPPTLYEFPADHGFSASQHIAVYFLGPTVHYCTVRQHFFAHFRP